MQVKPLIMYRSNQELLHYMISNNVVSGSNNVRSSVKIAVIDDNEFLPRANLLSHGYEVQEIGDVKKIEEVRKFNIVLCDLMGVGMHFDNDRQGATIIEEIRSQYPAILVVAYTGSSLGSAQARAAKEFADNIIKKDSDIADWTTLLDKLSFNAVDPYQIWNRMRLSFVHAKLDTKSILVLEDAFVKSVINNDAEAKSLQKAAKDIKVGVDVKSIINGVIASAIFAMFG